MREFLFDTCFLIDLERERRRGPGRAHAFLAMHQDAVSRVSWTIVGEFGEGFGSLSDPICAALLARFETIEMNLATASEYARITALLRKRNAIIGVNDLWIAAAALAHNLPLVTNNQEHFGRVPSLSVVGY